MPRAETQTVSTLTSLRDFRARLPNGGACSGSDAETTDSGSEYDDDDYTEEEETDEDDAQLAAVFAAHGVHRDLAQPTTPPLAHAGNGIPNGSGAARPAPASSTASSGPAASAESAPDSLRSCAAAEARPPAAVPATNAALSPSAAKVPAAASTVAAAVPGRGWDAESQPASAQPAAEDSAAAPSRPAQPHMPDSGDFQALSVVLRQFLAALNSSSALRALPAEVQAARLGLVQGGDGSLSACSASGASVQLSWRFPPPPDS